MVIRWDSSSGDAVRALLGATDADPKLWEDQAPQGTETPYVTMSDISSDINFSMSADFPGPRIEWAVWDAARSSLQAQKIADEIYDLYNNQKLAMDNGWTMVCADPVTPVRKIRDNLEKGFQIIVEFDYILERDR